MIWVLYGAATLVAALALYLVAWPVPIAPRRWTPGRDAGFVGPFASNRELAGLNRIEIGGRAGPEHIAFGADGRLHTGVAGGDILSMNPDGSDLRILANTQGRVLGLTFDRQGRLLVADAMRGLLAVGGDGDVRPLVEQFEGAPILLANSVIVADDGLIYFTDSSRRFGARRWGSAMAASVLDILEQQATGRILTHAPKSGETRLVAQGLSFANGIALSCDQRFLFVNETGQYRIWRIPVEARGLDLTSGPAGGASILIDNLPGFPDNLMRGMPGRDGASRIWCGLVKPRNPALDQLADKLFLRKVALRLPDAMKPIPRDYSHVFAFDDEGRVLVSLQDPAAGFPEITSAAEFGGRLYLASLTAGWIGWRARPN